jgi:hypothetical protein
MARAFTCRFLLSSEQHLHCSTTSTSRMHKPFMPPKPLQSGLLSMSGSAPLGLSSARSLVLFLVGETEVSETGPSPFSATAEPG